MFPSGHTATRIPYPEETQSTYYTPVDVVRKGPQDELHVCQSDHQPLPHDKAHHILT